jgi:hypothetical protein
LEITSNPELTSIYAFTLSSVHDITLRSTPLMNLMGLHMLEMAHHVFIEDTAIQTLHGLNTLSMVDKLSIRFNSQLKSFHGAENIQKIMCFIVTNNQQLRSLDGLDGISAIDYIKLAASKPIAFNNLAFGRPNLKIRRMALVGLPDYTELELNVTRSWMNQVCLLWQWREGKCFVDDCVNCKKQVLSGCEGCGNPGPLVEIPDRFFPK